MQINTIMVLYMYTAGIQLLTRINNVLFIRGVNRAKISGPARKNFFRPGPARNQCIIKFVLYNFFEILQQNQYNYI